MVIGILAPWNSHFFFFNSIIHRWIPFSTTTPLESPLQSILTQLIAIASLSQTPSSLHNTDHLAFMFSFPINRVLLCRQLLSVCLRPINQFLLNQLNIEVHNS